MTVLFLAMHHFCFDSNATNNKRESQRIEMLSGYDYGNVFYSCEPVMGCVALDAFESMA